MSYQKYNSKVKAFFKKGGILSKSLSSYNYRNIQEKMSLDIIKSICEHKDIIIEAGTGVGKTFAYLVPSLLSDKKIIISTGTKTLQEQIFKKDLPVINNLIENPKQVILLKGRRNYICKYKLEHALLEDNFESKDLARDMKNLLKWYDTTKTGDISEAKKINEKSFIWNKVTVGKDGCLNKECPYFKNCFVMEVKKKAQSADIVIVNHHLLLSDWKLIKEDNNFLPKSDVIILDEAHQIPDLIHDYFGDYFSSISIKDLFKEIIFYVKNNSLQILGLDNLAVKTDNNLNEIFKLLDNFDISRNDLISFKKNINFHKLIVNVKIELEKLKLILDSHRSKSKEIENFFQRTSDYLIIISRIEEYFDKSINEQSKIYWYEVYNKNFNLIITPIDISKDFRDIINALNTSMVFTSATISTNNNFDYFINNLGLENRFGLTTKIYESPFDFANQAILYSPRYLPNPDHISYTEDLIENIIPIIKKTKGRAFLLFTSYRALNVASEYLKNNYPEFNLLIQGDMNKIDIIVNFKLMENSLLLGTSTFWEGVDIKGDDLQCVIIDKLPFASPYDPITQGKIKYLRFQGKDPFQELQCPKAAIALKQGAGRLIRDFNDYGVLVIADPRIVTKEYGGGFLNSLPQMKRTRDINKVLEFVETKQVV